MINIVLFGPPGAGKGTQSKKIIEKYQLIHLSTGDLLRAEVMAETELGKKAKDLMSKGLLVPDEIVIGMIENKVKSNTNAKGFVFDGFPRTIAQAEALDNLMSKNNIKISGTVALEVDEVELTKRILERGKLSGRIDDQNETLVKNRVKVYFKETAPVADYYKKQNKFTSIQGIGEVEDIFKQICTTLDSYGS
ncbi:MAG: adenylate kinase [Cytophagales bacterium]|nr:MAG: adenylate kinase [Cytophagales bacterium]